MLSTSRSKAKRKIKAEGEACRHCGTPVIEQKHQKMPEYKPGGYYFLWWFKCPKCKALYMDEDAKVFFDAENWRMPVL